MTRRLFFLGILFLGLISAQAQTTTSPQASGREGQRIAAELRSSIPNNSSSIQGVLEIRPKKSKTTEKIPVLFRIEPKRDHWDSIYETGHTANRAAEKVIVRRFHDRPNQYFYARASSPHGALPELKEIKPEGADIPLAGSDFWLTDLGLDFLYWPEQFRPRGEMRLGQWCHVLESVHPKRSGVNRIVSWIDQDSADQGIAGILIAEAYSPENKHKPVKSFTLSGSSFKKVNGRWQLEKMDIQNHRTGSKTTLRFDLDSINALSSTAQ